MSDQEHDGNGGAGEMSEATLNSEFVVRSASSSLGCRSGLGPARRTAVAEAEASKTGNRNALIAIGREVTERGATWFKGLTASPYLVTI